MKPSEVLHVCASSPRRITEDPEVSSPTFPTCWLDCRQAGRPCSSKIQSWLPAAVRFRTSRRLKPCQMQLRTQHQHFLWAIFFGSAASAIGYVTLCLRPLGWVYGHTACRAHSACSPLFVLIVPSFLFSGGFQARVLRRTVVGWSHSSFLARGRRLFTGIQVLGQPGPDSVPGSCSYLSGGILPYLEVGDEFSLAVFFVVWWSISSCGRLTWCSYCRWSWWWNFTPLVYTMSESRWYDLAEVSGADTDEEEGRCTDRQIMNSTANANTPGLRAERRWPWLRSLVVFLAWREWLDERLVRVAFVF